MVLAHLYLGPELVLAEMEMGQELLQLVLDLRFGLVKLRLHHEPMEEP